MKEIDRLLLGLGRLGNELVRGRFVETECALDDGVQLGALGIGDVAVDGGGMDQQRCRRQAIVVVLEVNRMLAAVRHLGEKPAKACKHASGTLRS